jgi:hypothetical protein
MDFAHPTFDWHQLANGYYRKQQIYEMAWQDVDLKLLNIVAAPFAGPIAAIRNEKLIIAVTGGQMKPTMQIYTSSGEKISSFIWDKGKLVGMGWTDNEKLICVLQDGSVLIYNVLGELVGQFTLGRECKEQGVLDVKIWGTGLVALTGELQLVAVTNVDDRPSQPRQLADPQLEAPPTSWTIVEPRHTLSKSVEVFLATTSGTILVVDAEGVKDQLLSYGPFTNMVVSPSGTTLACITRTGEVHVCLTDFSKDLYQFATQTTHVPMMAWCGNDTLTIYWPDEKDKVLLFMVDGEWLKFTYEPPVLLVPEIDGMRIITNQTCEFMQRVPFVTEEIFKIGSTAPAAMLYDALEHFEKKSPKADENIRSIKNELSEAVDACIEAAGHEFNYPAQRTLLKAASFGKCFLDFYNPDKFVEMCKTLRVLNAVRFYEVGIPLTIPQFQELGPLSLIDRLVNRHKHLLAWRICEFLKIKGDKVLVHWACSKVKTNAFDNEISDSIIDKLRNVPGISYATIANSAFQCGRPKLATQLLDYEPRAADQVPLLLSMHEDELALVKAIESGDTDLVYLVILHVKRTKPLQEFMTIVYNKPAAMDLLQQYCKQQDRQLLSDIYLFFDLKHENANLSAYDAYQATDFDSGIKHLQTAFRYYNETKDYQFNAKVTEDQMKLLLLQKDLEATYSQKFLELPLGDTLSKLMLMGESKRAIKIRSEFKVPDKRFWWLRLKALVEMRDWESLEKFAKEKKSPIGYEPFVDLCIEAKANPEAAKYVSKITTPATRAEYYLKLGMWKEAADVAMKEKDPEMLLKLRNNSTNREAVFYFDNLLQQFQAKK